MLSKVVSNTNWEWLRNQKLWLLTNGSDEAIGISHYLDAIQDAAVADELATKIDVFGDLADDTETYKKLFQMLSEAKVLVQGDDSYVIDFADTDVIHVTHEDTGEEFVMVYDDINLETDLIYGLVLLNKS